jgi:hypothetical protein
LGLDEHLAQQLPNVMGITAMQHLFKIITVSTGQLSINVPLQAPWRSRIVHDNRGISRSLLLTATSCPSSR